MEPLVIWTEGLPIQQSISDASRLSRKQLQYSSCSSLYAISKVSLCIIIKSSLSRKGDTSISYTSIPKYFGGYLLRPEVNKCYCLSYNKMIENKDDNYQQGLSRWLTCIALVTFDVDEGQKLQLVVPSVNFNKQTEKQIAMLAFPDSNSFSDHENTFKYTFKAANGLFGFTCFKQKKDPNNPRGFSQRSLVILSELPFVYFFEKMAEFVVFKTFSSMSNDELKNNLQELCVQVSKWPDPVPKMAYILPVLQYELEIQIPNYLYSKERNHSIFGRKIEEKQVETELKEANKQFNLKNILAQEQLLRHGPFQQIKLTQIFHYSSEAIWALWESVMLNNSILLMGQNPQQVSHAVLGAISLIYPFQYCGHYNPYITIYDSHLDSLTKQTKDWLIGGTNPLFAKLFKPEITRIVSLDAKSGSTYKCNKNLKPLKQLMIKSTSQEQMVINQAAIRKHFSQLSRAVMTILDIHLNQQANNLKFFHEGEFLKKLKERKQFLGLENIFSSKKYVLAFFQNFMSSANFDKYLTNKNAIRARK